jgi:hypothetical protein
MEFGSAVKDDMRGNCDAGSLHSENENNMQAWRQLHGNEASLEPVGEV